MIKRHIFKGGRGCGKTNWLCEQIKMESDSGKTCYFVGKKAEFMHVKEVYMSKYSELPKIKMLNLFSKVQLTEFSAFSDNYWYDQCYAPGFKRDYEKPMWNVDWYITMDAEDFVN